MNALQAYFQSVGARNDEKRRAEEERRKRIGKISAQVAGTTAGIALAPFTGGASIPIGSAVGGLSGELGARDWAGAAAQIPSIASASLGAIQAPQAPALTPLQAADMEYARRFPKLTLMGGV